jgi:hypothetical protein
MVGQYRVIFQAAQELGAHTVQSCIPADYTGACSVIAASDGTSVIAVIPNLAEANRVARYATRPDGGFGSVYIKQTDSACMHLSFQDWLS